MDAIVAFAFGSPSYIPSNQCIGDQAIKAARYFRIPIVTQLDIPIHSERNTDEIFFIEAQSSPLAQSSTYYVSTYDVARYTAFLAQQHKWKDVLVFAAPDHMRRCLRDLRHFGFLAHSCQTTSFALLTPKEGWYSKESAQKHTQSSRRFWIRELLLRVLPWLVYERLTANSCWRAPRALIIQPSHS